MSEPEPVNVSRLSPDEIAARYGSSRSSSWKLNRRRNRALGLDRFGRPLPRVAGTNPRALGTNPKPPPPDWKSRAAARTGRDAA